MTTFESNIKQVQAPQSAVYAKLSDLNNLAQVKDRLPEMSEEEQLELLSTDGMLVKRPILVTEDKVLVGFRQKEWETL